MNEQIEQIKEILNMPGLSQHERLQEIENIVYPKEPENDKQLWFEGMK